ncbi:hypothetical protein H257_18667 [Aphanomyces astaci]|uniref:Endonuclease/exonuclease/phosphatase domain-containing protein n=1 Tax=Aphanomyces astaci TaxID=112090 RepID=W4FAC4_APHAT|nr:hypothetical protein H257_18667 [Aphanomyces astaci]ETV64450.1 hypothetical protein H257_18667 [Aphanomyces astaci]|eukprot:XP_009846063.1 hypothetical protein H257_18667 [Aphanomyces astaci]
MPDAQTYSPSGRSISICIRLGKGSLITLIGTYCQDIPTAHREETNLEWQWLTQAAAHTTEPHHFVVMGGDFNTYGTNPLDRSAPTPRSSSSTDMGTAFQHWLERIGLSSTFRYRHPSLQRHTYTLNNTAVALDDIYITSRTAHKLEASGIWLNTIHSSDHAGTPFMTLNLCPGDHTPSRLSGANPSGSSTHDILQRTKSPRLAHTPLIYSSPANFPPCSRPPPHAATTWTPQATTEWLEGAVQNLYDILYTSAKLKWGETSQTRKALNRAVVIQRTNRCTAQLRHLLRLHEACTLTGTEYRRLAHMKSHATPDHMVAPAGRHRGGRLVDHHALSTGYHPRLGPLAPAGHSTLGQRMPQTAGLAYHCIRQTRVQQRTAWFQGRQTPKFLRSAIGAPIPPISIQSAIVRTDDGPHGTAPTEKRWQQVSDICLITGPPPAEKTTRPRHLDSGLAAGRQHVPHFVREWLLHDMDRPDAVAPAF